MATQTHRQFPRFTGRLPERLVWDVKRGACVLFAGAGLSSQVMRTGGKPLPAWGTFLHEIAILARNDGFPVTDDLVLTIDKGRLLEAGQDLQQMISASSLEGYLADIFADPAVLPSSTHLILPGMPLRAVLTTNYDTLIEDAYLEVTGSVAITLTYEEYVRRPRDPIRNNDFFVYKIHGDYRDASSIALGTRSYQELIHWNPGYRFLLESIFAAYTVLFVGFGGSDPDVNHVLDALAVRFRAQSTPHYMLLPAGRSTETEKRHAQEDRNLELIEYDATGNHIQVGAFLEELAFGRPDKGGKLRIAVVAHRGDEDAVASLRPALSASHYILEAFDLSRVSQAGWFDELRAQIELCDVVVAVIGGTSHREHNLVKAVAANAQRKVIWLIAGLPGIPTSLAVGAVMLTTADELWLGSLVEQLEQIRLAVTEDSNGRS